MSPTFTSQGAHRETPWPHCRTLCFSRATHTIHTPPRATQHASHQPEQVLPWPTGQGSDMLVTSERSTDSSSPSQAPRSPSRPDSVRDKRRRSDSTSLRSQPSTPDAPSSRAKSVFRGQHDPYFPLKGNNPSLPASDDYVFRIQVISTAIDLDSDVFRRAVQGLVKICFPQNVLEELGIQVITQHMRNEHVPEQNVIKMADIFRSEMIHRVIWMLAEYLDTPVKVDSSIKAVMAASASLHGASIGENVLAAVIDSLNHLKEELPNETTAWLANTTDLKVSSFKRAQSDTINSNAKHIAPTQDMHPDKVAATAMSSEEGIAQTLPTENETRQRIKMGQQNESVTPEPDDISHQLDRPSRTTPTRKGKENRISTSWRWNVQGDISLDDVSEHFKRPNDLFAYHALPIAKQRLGAQAKRKKVRQEIEAMLAAMPGHEIDKWVDIYRTLEGGDLGMLQRVSPNLDHLQRHAAPPTPAPGLEHSRSRLSVTSIPSFMHSKTPSPNAASPSARAFVKQEHILNEADSEARSLPVRGASDGAGSVARDTRPPGPDTGSIHQRAGSAGQADVQAASNHLTSTPSDTPIMDLLWGQRTFDEHDRRVVAVTVMEHLTSRVPSEFIGVTRFDGSTIVQTKQKLQALLLDRDTKSHSGLSNNQVRILMERQLQPWIIANLPAFPGFQPACFVFVEIMPNLSTIADLFFDRKTPLLTLSNEAIRLHLTNGLKARQYPEHSENPYHLQRAVKDAIRSVNPRGRDDIVVRCILEKTLRRAAFMHRSGFRELEFSTLVKGWQRTTKQMW